MTAPIQPSGPPVAHGADEALTLALNLAQAVRAIQAFALGQIDPIVGPDGKTYLLRPAQQNLRQNERRLQAILDGVADVVTLVNQTGVILSQSRPVRRIFGHTADSLAGTCIFRLIHEEDVREVYSAFFNVREGFLEQATVRFRHRADDGSYREIEASLGRLNDGSARSVIFSSRSAAAPQVRIEPVETPLAVISSSLLKGRFLAMLSHELRAPLTGVLLGIDELQEDERFIEARPVLTMIRRNLKLQSLLLDELADFTTVEQHKVRLRLESIDVHQHIGFVLQICRREIEAANIEVRLDLRAEEPLVLADSLRLHQVMWNLVKNAIKYSIPDGSISITTANEGPGVTLAFVDYGIGIERDLLPLVFDPFQQGDRSMQHPSGGLGLGLFIAKKLAEAQGGTLTAFSEGRGEGATFRLTLKAADTTTDSLIQASQATTS